MIFKMLVGIPGCGKSTYCENNKDFITHSSDAIREEFGLAADEGAKTFEILHNRVISDLRNGKNVIFDATNLSRKHRMNFLKCLDNSVKGCEKICVLFVVPVEVCKERNRKRTRVVPEYVYDRMLSNFEVPMCEEGFDSIEVVFDGFDKPVKMATWEELLKFDQCNHHHRLTLGEHMEGALANLKSDKKDVREAMLWHDIGKYYTKRFQNSKGEPTEEAHYLGHDNCGSYIYLVYKYAENPERDVGELLHISALINWHMAPYIRWKNEQRMKKDIEIFGEEFYNDICVIHDADVLAH